MTTISIEGRTSSPHVLSNEPTIEEMLQRLNPEAVSLSSKLSQLYSCNNVCDLVVYSPDTSDPLFTRWLDWIVVKSGVMPIHIDTSRGYEAIPFGIAQQVASYLPEWDKRYGRDDIDYSALQPGGVITEENFKSYASKLPHRIRRFLLNHDQYGVNPYIALIGPRGYGYLGSDTRAIQLQQGLKTNSKFSNSLLNQISAETPVEIFPDEMKREPTYKDFMFWELHRCGKSGFAYETGACPQDDLFNLVTQSPQSIQNREGSLTVEASGQAKRFTLALSSGYTVTVEQTDKGDIHPLAFQNTQGPRINSRAGHSNLTRADKNRQTLSTTRDRLDELIRGVSLPSDEPLGDVSELAFTTHFLREMYRIFKGKVKSYQHHLSGIRNIHFLNPYFHLADPHKPRLSTNFADIVVDLTRGAVEFTPTFNGGRHQISPPVQSYTLLPGHNSVLCEMVFDTMLMDLSDQAGLEYPYLAWSLDLNASIPIFPFRINSFLTHQLHLISAELEQKQYHPPMSDARTNLRRITRPIETMVSNLFGNDPSFAFISPPHINNQSNQRSALRTLNDPTTYYGFMLAASTQTANEGSLTGFRKGSIMKVKLKIGQGGAVVVES